MGVFPKKSPSSKITGPIEKIKGDAKMVGHPLSLSKVWWRSAPARRRKKGKLGVFCLSVCHDADVEQMFSHSNSDIVASWRSILMRISSFSGKQMLFQMFKRCLNYAARWRHTCLRISSKFEFIWKFEGQCLGAWLRPFRRRIEKNLQQPIPWL